MPPMLLLNQGIMPSLFRKLAIITRAANQTNVSQAPVSAFTSSQVSTPERRRTARPTRAAVVAFRSPNCLAKIQRISSRAKTPSIIHSWRFTGPRVARFCLLYTSDAADEEDSVDLG